jgi:ATP-dependent exoDNAse (exonuclease V) alpha subunit
VLDVGPGTKSVDAVRQSILQVERLAVLAIGSGEARRALAEDEGRVRR